MNCMTVRRSGFNWKQFRLGTIGYCTLAAIIERLQAELAKAMQHAEARERILGLGAEPVGSALRDAATFLKNETARWGTVSKEARIPLVD